MLHQSNRQPKVRDGLAAQLAAAGINVLTIDYRGFGEIGDDRFDKLPQQAAVAQQAKWPGDFDVAFQYLLSQRGVVRDRIAGVLKNVSLVGVSIDNQSASKK